jgi:hypothetical protein
MVLPIFQFDRDQQAGIAGGVSDASLVDTLTGVSTKTVRHGTLVAITGLAASSVNAPANAVTFDTLEAAAAGVAAKRLAIVSRSHFDPTYDINRAGGAKNSVVAGQPANLVETGRVWVITKDALVPVSQGPVAILPKATVNGVADFVGAVDNGVTTATPTAIRGLVFTGRVSKDRNGFTIAEVQIRPQTA